MCLGVAIYPTRQANYGAVECKGGYGGTYNNNLLRSGKDNQMEKRIIKIGQCHTDKSQSGIVYRRDGMMVTLIAGTHGYAMGYVLRKYEKDNSALRSGSRRRTGQSSVWGGYSNIRYRHGIQRPIEGNKGVWRTGQSYLAA